MIEQLTSEKSFESYMKYYITYQKSGNLKYFWEISVPDSEFDNFLSFLNSISIMGFSFGFQVINRYENYKLLYGFSNFDIIRQTPNMKLFDFLTQNNEALYECMYKWREESRCYLLSETVLFYLKS